MPPLRGQDQSKVERPYRYIREDFFLARSFRNLDDLNAHDTQRRPWLQTGRNGVLNLANGTDVDW